jgi:hypothetical protein
MDPSSTVIPVLNILVGDRTMPEYVVLLAAHGEWQRVRGNPRLDVYSPETIHGGPQVGHRYMVHLGGGTEMLMRYDGLNPATGAAQFVQ